MHYDDRGAGGLRSNNRSNVMEMLYTHERQMDLHLGNLEYTSEQCCLHSFQDTQLDSPDPVDLVK